MTGLWFLGVLALVGIVFGTPIKDPECPYPDPLNYSVQFPDPSDCSKYWVCRNGTKQLYTCPDGLEYNAKLQVCDWPYDAGCDSIAFGTTIKDPECPYPDPLNYTVQFPDPSDCSKFWVCKNGTKQLYTCTDGLEYNAKLQVCDWPYDAGCESFVFGTTMKDPECPYPDPLNYTVQFPDPSDCGKFWLCRNGTKQHHSCLDGLEYNAELGVCDWPSKAGCKFKDPECPYPDNLNYTVQLPYKGNCSRFWKCINGTKNLFNCTDGLEYNAKLGVCDWPSEASCNSSSSNPKTNGDDIRGEVETSGLCPVEDPSPPVYLKHEVDCTKFYECSNGTPMLLECPEGLGFNLVKKICDYTGCV